MSRPGRHGPRIVFAALAALIGGAADQPPPSQPAVRWVRSERDGRGVSVEVTGADKARLASLAKDDPGPGRWSEILAVTVGGKPGAPPMLGSYRVEGDILRFAPKFPLEPGVEYRASFDPEKLGGKSEAGEPIVSTFSLPALPSEPTAAIAAVYPDADTLPENLLKFYLHFSAPMGRGESYRHIRLLDESGREVNAPFLELGEELWDPSGTRFTLFLDPGRIKRGLVPREELGPILEVGRTYTLVIDREWPDAEGRPLKSTFRKTFRAGPMDEAPPDPATWKIAPPKAGTRDPLTLAIPEPLDHALLERVLRVDDADGRHVRGRVEVGDRGRRWEFRPESPWKAREYRIEISKDLEDLAGNSIGRPFEVDEFGPVTREVREETVRRTFRPE